MNLVSDCGKKRNISSPATSQHHPTPAPSTGPYQPILKHGLQEMRKGGPPILFACDVIKMSLTNANCALDNRNFQKSLHRTRSPLLRARSKMVLVKSAEGMLCCLDQVLQRRRLAHPLRGDRRTGSQYVILPTPRLLVLYVSSCSF